jgi:hypothetical protein
MVDRDAEEEVEDGVGSSNPVLQCGSPPVNEARWGRGSGEGLLTARAMTWSVLPKPMAEARTPPRVEAAGRARGWRWPVRRDKTGVDVEVEVEVEVVVVGISISIGFASE